MNYWSSNAYYFRHLNKIGGIESHLRYLAKKYATRYDMCVYYRTADVTQLNELKKYVRCVQLDKGDFVRCKKLFCCFNREILDQCQAEKTYLVLHGDYKDMVKRGQLNISQLPVDDRIDEYLGVSQLVCDSWEELTGIRAKNVYEPVVLDKTDKPLLFVSATRLTPEKGWERMQKLAKVLDEHNVNYLWFVYSNYVKDAPRNMIFLDPRLDITDKIGSFDAYIQLSDNEGFCLSIVEALLRGLPVIATDLPVLKEIGLNENNSITLPFNMENIPVERIKKIRELKFSYEQPKDKWGSVLDHTKPQSDLVKVRALEGYRNRNLTDAQLGRIPEKGETWITSRQRYEDLCKYAEKQKIRLVELDGTD